MRTAFFLAVFLIGVSIGVPGQRAFAQHFTVVDTLQDGNLTLYLISTQGALSNRTYLTLDEAIKSHKATLKETGTTDLLIENHSDQDIFIQSASIVKGGQQDRMLANDLIIPAGGEPVVVPAYCVEHDRSFQRGAEPLGEFSAAYELAPIASLRVLAKKPLIDRTGTTVSTTSRGDGLTAPSDSNHRVASNNEQALLDQLALYESRSVFQESVPQKALQESIWRDVGFVQAGLSTLTGHSVKDVRSPSSLELSLEDTAIESQIHPGALLQRLKNKVGRATGIVYAINGELRGAEIYSSSELFQSELSTLLTSMNLEAMLAVKEAPTERAENETVIRFLDFLPGSPIERDLSIREHVKSYAGGGLYRFETIDSLEPRTVLHLSILKAEIN